MITLVTGATGMVGSQVVRELQSRGATVRAFVRDRERAQAVLGHDVELAVGDLSDPTSLRAGLEKVDQLFLMCANSPRQAELETKAIEAADHAGTARIVKLSARGAQRGSPLPFWDWQGRIEEHLRASGIPHVLLRPTYYMSNLLAFADSIRYARTLFAPAAEAKVAMVDPRDVADAGAVVLTEEGHDGCAYELTGPEAITFHRVGDELSEATGRPVRYVSVPDEAALGALVEAGMPEWMATSLVGLFGLLRRGAGEHVTDVVRVLTHREPRTITDFVRDHASFFRT